MPKPTTVETTLDEIDGLKLETPPESLPERETSSEITQPDTITTREPYELPVYSGQTMSSILGLPEIKEVDDHEKAVDDFFCSVRSFLSFIINILFIVIFIMFLIITMSAYSKGDVNMFDNKNFKRFYYGMLFVFALVFLIYFSLDFIKCAYKKTFMPFVKPNCEE